MAKKTSYLTELIERHERWKAEGGERLEDEEQDLVSDLYAQSIFMIEFLTHQLQAHLVPIPKIYGTSVPFATPLGLPPSADLTILFKYPGPR